MATPDYKRLRTLRQAIESLDRPPFTVTHNGDKVVKEDSLGVLAYVMEDAKSEFTITRFKGLGEMNPQQLWDQVRELLAEQVTKPIFATYLSEAVEAAASEGRLQVRVPSSRYFGACTERAKQVHDIAV